MRRSVLVKSIGLFGCSLFSLLGVSGAAAQTVTVGPDLNGLTSGVTYDCSLPGGCTYGQTGAPFVSPISGVIVRWRISESTGQFTLRVLNGNTGTATAQPEQVTSKALHEFPADLPIKAGEKIGVDAPEKGSSLAILYKPGTALATWDPILPDGQTRGPTSSATEFELLLNAEIQPPPGITGLAPAAGPIKSADKVVISGHDFTGASAVTFGSQPAAGFTVDSESQITATAPASASKAEVPVSVTTVAGTASSPQPFAYQGCLVPKLTGKKLKAAKKKVKVADCKLGKVTRENGATGKTGKVVKQSPKAGKLLAPGSKVKVVLGPL